MSKSLLTVDVGNSRIKFGRFDSSKTSTGRMPACLNFAAVDIDAAIGWDEIRGWFDDGESVSGIVAGANPQGVDKVFESWPAGGWSRPLLIDNPTDFPLDVHLKSPEHVGIDRLLNAVAANVVRPAGRPAIIVDTGTATTVDYVSADGAFEGGAILPGIEMSARALHHYTALLPFISIEELAEESDRPLGKTTREALRSGLFWGQLGAVRELIGRWSQLSDVDAFLLLTGGGAGLLAQHLPEGHWDPHLSLEGLALIAQTL